MGGAGGPPGMDIRKSGAYFIKIGCILHKSWAQYNLRVFLLGGNNQREMNKILFH